jgi:hypothetical protein
MRVNYQFALVFGALALGILNCATSAEFSQGSRSAHYEELDEKRLKAFETEVISNLFRKNVAKKYSQPLALVEDIRVKVSQGYFVKDFGGSLHVYVACPEEMKSPDDVASEIKNYLEGRAMGHSKGYMIELLFTDHRKAPSDDVAAIVKMFSHVNPGLVKLASTSELKSGHKVLRYDLVEGDTRWSYEVLKHIESGKIIDVTEAKVPKPIVCEKEAAK